MPWVETWRPKKPWRRRRRGESACDDDDRVSAGWGLKLNLKSPLCREPSEEREVPDSSSVGKEVVVEIDEVEGKRCNSGADNVVDVDTLNESVIAAGGMFSFGWTG